MRVVHKQMEFVSKSGNTELIYIVHSKRKSLFKILLDEWNNLSARKQYLIIQKLLGVGLLIIGIIGTAFMPEDAGGFVFIGVLGILRLICND